MVIPVYAYFSHAILHQPHDGSVGPFEPDGVSAAPSSKTEPTQVRYTFGLDLHALLAREKLIPFFDLLTRFGFVPSTHNRQAEGLGGAVKSFWAHHLFDFYSFFMGVSIRLF